MAFFKTNYRPTMDHIPAGEFKHRLEHRIGIYTKDANGGPLYGFSGFSGMTGYRILWAVIKPLGGRELDVAKGIYGDVDVEIWVRWQPDLTIFQGDALVSSTTTYNVVSCICPDEKKKYFKIMCKQVRT